MYIHTPISQKNMIFSSECSIGGIVVVGFVFVCLCVNRTVSAGIVTFLEVLPRAGDRYVTVHGVRCF